jgi:hypothetical protein
MGAMVVEIGPEIEQFILQICTRPEQHVIQIFASNRGPAAAFAIDVEPPPTNIDQPASGRRITYRRRANHQREDNNGDRLSHGMRILHLCRIPPILP